MFARKKRTAPEQGRKPKSASKAPGEVRPKLSLISLESRLMFDAAAAATAAEVNQEQVAQEQAESAVSGDDASSSESQESAESQELLQAIATYSPGETTTEIVFVDPTVPNYQELLSGMDPNIEVIMLDSGKDGMEQMAASLAGRTGIDAIHIISHGTEGQLSLGTGTLTQASMLGEYADELATIKQTLSESADILVYGCDFAEGEAGQEAARLLSELTGADVAASTDDTGYADLGGDWDFEFHVGAIETEIAFSYDTQADWVGLLSLTASGSETRVNTTTSSTQTHNSLLDAYTPDSVAMDANGNYVSVWESAGDIYGQRYNSTGTAQGSEFVIAANAANERLASVSMNPSGAFVVTWERDQGSGDYDIYARVYNASGTAVTSAFLVNETTTFDQEHAHVAMAADGSFVVVWESNTEAGGTYYDDIYAQRYDATGAKIGSNFLVNSTTSGDQQEADIAMDSAGNFVVVWSGERTAGTSVYSIYGQRYDASGVAQGGQFLVNSVASDNDQHASVAMNDSGNFVVTWDRQSGGSTDSDVQAQRFNSSGVAQGGAISVTNTNSWWQDIANVAMDQSGNFVVSWSSNGQDGSGLGVYTRQYDSTGTALTTESRVATTTSNAQDYSGIAYQNGKVVVTWSGNGPGDSSGIFMQRYDAAGGNAAPTITSNGGGVTAAINVAENTTAVTTVTATDANADTVIYSISGGADASKFTINSSTGALSFITAPNYESPTDSGGNNVYDVIVTVKDNNGGADSQSIAVTVTDVNETVVNNVPGAQTTNEDTAKVFSSGNGNQISITDIDAGSNPIEVTLSVTNGTLTLAGTAGLTFTSGDGTSDSTMTFRGTVTNINTALNGLSYSPTANYSGSATLTITSLDNTLVSLNIDANLQARYTFEGNANDVAPGTAQNGTLTNGASIITDGTRGQVLGLDGVNDFVDLSAHTGTFSTYTQGTISGWIKSTGTFETIFAISDTADTGSYAALFLGASGYLTYEVVENGVMQLAVYKSDVAINDGNWHHVAVSIGPTGNVLYVDGVAATSGQLTYDTGNASTQRFFSSVSSLDSMAIGRNQDSSGGKWYATGSLDDVRLYDRVLSTSEVANLANDLTLVDTDTVALTVNPVNDAPTITNLGGDSVAYSEGAGAVVIEQDGNALVADVDSANFDTGTLTVSFTAGSDSVEDVLGIRNQGTSAGQIGVSGSIITYGGTTIGTFTGGSGGSNLVITFNSNATPTAVTALVKNITYQDTDTNAPTTGARTVRFVLTDGDGGTSANYNTTVTVSAVNDAPVLADTALSLTVAEDAGTPSGAVGSLVSAFTGGITEPDGGTTKGIAITGSNETNGTWYYTTNGGTTWTAVGAVSNTSALLLADNGNTRLYFAPSANYNGTSTAALTVRAWDQTSGTAGTKVTTASNGGATAFSTATDTIDVTVNPVNDAPTITSLSGDSLNYSEGGGAVVIEQGGNALVADIDSANFDTGTLTVSIPAGGDSAEDVLGIRNQGTSAGQIGVSGSTITYGGTAIGTFTGGSSGSNLVITLNSNATSTAVTALVKNITYENTDVNAPTTSARTVRYVLTDGDGGTSASYDTTVTVSGVNDAPVLADTTLSLTVAEDAGVPSGAVGSLISAFTGGITDVDSGAVKGIAITGTDETNGTWYYTTNGGTTWTVVGTVSDSSALVLADNANTRLYFAPDANYNGTSTDAITFRAWDQTSDVPSDTTILQSYEAPFSEMGDQAYELKSGLTWGQTFSYDSPAATYTVGSVGLVLYRASDAPAGQTLTVSLRSSWNGAVIASGTISSDSLGTSEAWVSIDLTSQATLNDNQTYYIRVDSNSTGGKVYLGVDGSGTYATGDLINKDGVAQSGKDTVFRISQVTAGMADTTSNGGTTAFSSATDTIDVTVTAVNDAPTDLSSGIELNTDGGNDAYLIADDGGAILGGLSSLTYEIQFATDDTSSFTPLVSYATATNDNEFAFVFAGTDAYLYIANNDILLNSIDYTSLRDGTLQHLAVTWDNTNGDWAVYSNGVLIEQGTGHEVGITIEGGGELVFGNEQDALGGSFQSNQAFKGTYYDVRIWNDVRTAGELAQYDQQQLDLTAAEAAAIGLVANWQMDGLDGSNQVVDIVSGNNLSIAHASGTGFTAGTVNAQLSIDENSANGSHVGFVTTQDPDASETFSYSLTDSAGGRFAVNSSTGEITVANGSLLDYESGTSHNITVQVTDSGGLTYDEIITIRVNDLDDVPVNAVPGAQTVVEDTSLAITGISVTDVNGNLSTVQLSVTNGTLNVTPSGSATISAGANSSSTLTLSGSQADINATLASLVYQGNLNFNGADTLTVVSTDATANTDTDMVAITVTAQNDAPTDLSSGIELNTDGGNDAYLISDTGLSQSLSATTVEIRFAANDLPLETVLMSFNNPTGDELSIQLDDPSNNLEIDFGAGTVAYASAIDYRAALVDGTVHTLSVTWDSTAGDWAVYIDGAFIESGTGLSAGSSLDTTNGQFVFGQEQDGLDSGYDSTQYFSGTIYDVRIWSDVRTSGEIAQYYQQQLDVTPAEAAAVGLVANWQMDGFDGSNQVVDIVSGNNLRIAHASGTGFTAGTVNAQLSIDENSANGSHVGFVTTQDPDASETFSYSLTDSAGGRFAVNSVTGEVTVANGSLLDYESGTSHNITVRVTDSGGLTYDEVLTIQVKDVEEAPVNQVPGAQSTNEDTTLTFNAVNSNLIAISDDSGETLVVTLSVNNGTVTLSGTTGLTFTTGDGTADATMTFSGTVENINAALDGLQYGPTTNYSGSDTLTITSYDQTLYSLDFDANLQGYYQFNSADPGNDSSPSGTLDGTLNGGATVVTDGTRGEVLSLDGVDDSVVINGTYGNPTNLTLAGWVNLDAGETAVRLISIGDSVGISLDYGGVGVSAFFNDGVTLQRTDSNVDVAGTGWHHIAYVIDDAANTQTIYIDGVAIATTNYTGSIDYATATQTFIGSGNGFGFMSGSVDDARIYDRALSGGEVQGLASAPVTASDSDTVAITVNPVNDAPTISNLDGDVLNYTEGDGVVIIEQGGNALVSDIDSANFDGGDLNVEIDFGLVATEDVLSIRNQGTGSGQIGVSGSNVTYEGVVIGTFTGGTGLNPLNIVFNANATAEAVTALVKNITYENTNTDNPTASARSVTIDLTDGDGGASPTQNLTINVSGVNDAPVNTVPGAQSVNEDTPLALSGVSVNDVDGNLSTVQLGVLNGTVSVTLQGTTTISAGASGTNTLTLSGNQADINATLATLVYQGTLNYSGSDTLTVTSTDANSGTDVDTVALTVTAVNDAPVNTVPGAQSVNEDTPLALSGVSVNDVDGNLSTVQLGVLNGTVSVTLQGTTTISAGASGTNTLTLSGSQADINATLATLVYQGTLNYSGSDTLTVTSTDANSGTDVDTVALTVTAVNDAPVNTVPGAQSVNEDTPLALSGVSVNDVDGNLSTVQLGVLNGTVSVTLQGTTTISAGASGTNTLTLSGSQADINATLATLVYQGTLNYSGSDTLTVTSTDANSGTDVDTVALTVTAVNDAPVNTVPGAQSVNEDTPLALSGVSVNDVDGNLSTVQLGVLNGTVSVTLQGTATISAGASGTNTLTLSGSQADINATLATLVYQGTLNYSGSDTLTVTSTDANSGTDVDTVALTVTAVNDAPVNTVPGAQSVNEDTPLALSGVSVNDVDGNLSTVQLGVLNGTVSVTLQGTATISAGASGTNTLTLSGSQADINATLATLVYQGTLNYSGSDTLTVTSTDANSGTDVDTVALTVTAVNDAPVNTVPGAQSVNEDTPLALSGVSVNDVDGNLSTVQLGVLNGTVSVTLQGTTTISAGASGTNTLTLSGSQADINATLATLVYQGTLNYSGSDTLTVTSTDANSGTDVDTVALTVTAVNDAPVNTVPGAQSVNEDTPLALSGVSVNDVDGNLSTVQLGVLNGTVSVTLQGTTTISAGASGTNTLTLSGSQADINATLATLVYQGTLNYSGSDTLTVTSTDANSGTDVDTVALTVTAVNDAPVNTVPGAQSVNEDTPLALSGVSVNDVDGNLSTVQLGVLNGTVSVTLQGTTTISAGASGTNTLTLSGSQADINATLATLVYQGTLNYSGSDTLTVTSTDANSGTDVDTVALTVTAVNDAPTVVANTGSTVAEGGTDTINSSELVVNDVEQTAPQLTYSIGSGPAYGRLELTTAPGVAVTTFTQADIDLNRLVYVHDGSETTSDNFTFTVSDGAGGSSGPVTMTLTITPVNDAPTITSNGGGATASINVAENVSAVTIVTGADVDLPAQTLTYSISGGVDQARFTINAATGALHFTAPPDFEVATDANGDNVYVVQVQVIDGQGASTTQTIQVTVTDVTEGLPPTPTVPPVLLPPAPPGPIDPNPVPPSPPNPSDSPTDILPPSPVAPGSRSTPSDFQPVNTASVSTAPVVERLISLRDELKKLIDISRDQAGIIPHDDTGRPVFTVLPVEPVPVLEPELVEKPPSTSELLLTKLSEMAGSLEQAIGVSEERHELVTRVAALTGTTLSAGFIVWALRSGALLASFMATMPAWRHFDPLPVLGGTRNEWERRRKDSERDQQAEAAEYRGLKKLLG